MNCGTALSACFSLFGVIFTSSLHRLCISLIRKIHLFCIFSFMMSQQQQKPEESTDGRRHSVSLQAHVPLPARCSPNGMFVCQTATSRETATRALPPRPYLSSRHTNQCGQLPSAVPSPSRVRDVASLADPANRLGGGGILAEGPNLPPFLSFSMDLGHFISKMLNFDIYFVILCEIKII